MGQVLNPPNSGSCRPSLKTAILSPSAQRVSQHQSLQVPRVLVKSLGVEGRHLVEKDVLAVSALGGELLYDALGADAMLSTQLFPELEPN